MELIRLNKQTHIEESRYENYESLAWNEKFEGGADFQMRSYNVEEVLNFLQLGTLVTIPDSTCVAKVDEISYDLANDGTRMINVMGNSVDSIFKHRPARWEIAAMTNPDRVAWPEHGDWGDALETNPAYFLKPTDMLYKIVRRIDVQNYGKPSLSNLRLPFKYTLVKPENGRIREETIPSYTWDGGDVDGVIRELQGFGQFGVTTIRPGSHNYDVYMRQAVDYARANNWEESYFTESRPTLVVMYFPDYKADRIVFSSTFDDYIGAQNTITLSPNVQFRSTEDGVMETRIGDVRPQGLDARVTYDEKSVEKVSLYEEIELIKKFDMIRKFAEENLNANKFSLDMDGYHPYREKKFGLRPDDDNYYYLGDVVRVDFPWRAGYDVIVDEFVRTADSSGYREYPTFKPFVTTANFIEDSPRDIHSMAFRTAMQYLESHPDWL